MHRSYQNANLIWLWNRNNFAEAAGAAVWTIQSIHKHYMIQGFAGLLERLQIILQTQKLRAKQIQNSFLNTSPHIGFNSPEPCRKIILVLFVQGSLVHDTTT